jgi:PAS domain S-box-containing protein
MLDLDGHVVSWNAGAQRLKGYTAAEIIGQHFSRFFTDEDRKRGFPQEALAVARRVGRFESEGWRVRKDGTRFWVSAVLETIRDDGGNLIGFAKITRDMTERRAAHEALRISERRFRMLIDGITDYAIYMLDPSGIVINWNAGAQRIKGYPASEIVGHHFSRFFTPDDRAGGLPARILETAAREGRFESEGWRVRRDGSRFWASVVVDAIRTDSGELAGFAKITRDITERRAAQAALHESERQFRLLVEGVTDYAMYMLDPNGIISNWNSGAQRIKGYRADEVVGHHFSRFYTDADRAAGLPARALQTAAQHGRFETEGWRVRKDGSLFWANAVVDAIRDEHGRLIGFAKITRDISERRQAQIALEKAQAQLAHAQKMEALGQLTGGVAHDFNNLLMIVGGHAQLLKRRVTEPKDIRAIEAIEHATARGESLTRQLLTFSRRQRVTPATILLKERLDVIRDMLSSSLGDGVKLVIEPLEAVWPVEIDLTEFELALVNIAVNARDAMPDGGVITIAAENVTIAAGDLPAADVSGDFVALTVADNGVGIPPDVLPKVFDPFFTTKQVDKGTGLGLAQVYGFAHQAGGSVTISSEVGRGTRITLYLPRSRGTAGAAGQAEHGTVEDHGAATILLVEDNPEVAQVSAELLEQLHYRVRIAGGAEAALDLLAGGESVDLVISDIVMPGALSGIGLARALRERFPTLPVLLVTGYSKPAEDAHGEFPVLRKPYQMSELGRAVSHMLHSAPAAAAAPNLLRFPSGRKTEPGRRPG